MKQTLGRNDPCPCGSGKKYKNCCWGKNQPKAPSSQKSFFSKTVQGSSQSNSLKKMKVHVIQQGDVDFVAKTFQGSIRKAEAQIAPPKPEEETIPEGNWPKDWTPWDTSEQDERK
jgi:Predicted metal-binding protein related to the C-terminal domain of SecA